MKLALLSLLVSYASAFTSVVPLGPTSAALQVASDLEPPSTSPYTADSPHQMVYTLLKELHEDPDLHERMTWLLNSSTHKWRSKMYEAVGAPAHADEDHVAEALVYVMTKPDNQFAILLGFAEDFTIDFSTDTVELFDDKCWLECRLYDKKDGELLVASGWDLQRNHVSGGWLIDAIEWQDFRDAFYPGLGREEWAADV